MGCWLLAAPAARAANITWNGGFSEFWHSEFNWDSFGSPFSTRRVPGDGDTATLGLFDTTRLGADTAPINGLTLFGHAKLRTNGHQLQVDNAGAASTSVSGLGTKLNVEPVAGGGLAFHTDRLVVTDDAEATLDGNSRIDGDVLVSNGADLSATADQIELGGSLTVTGSARGFFFPSTPVTFAPNAMITVDSSSQLSLYTVSSITLTDGQTLRASSGGQFEAVTNAINVGAGGVGRLIVEGAGTEARLGEPIYIEQAALTIGHATDGAGLVRVASGATLTTALNRTTVNKTGTLEIDGGDLFVEHDLLIDGGLVDHKSGGFATAADRQITVQNGGVINTSDAFSVSSNKTLNVRSAGEVLTTGELNVGVGFSAGHLIVDGPGSRVQVASAPGFNLSSWGALGGQAFVEIQNQAEVDVRKLFLASSGQPGTTANVHVRSGASLDVSERLSMADTGVSGNSAVLDIYGEGSLVRLWSLQQNVIGNDAFGDATIRISDGGALDIDSDGGTTIHATGKIILEPGGTLTNRDPIHLSGGDIEMVGGRFNLETLNGDLDNQAGVLSPHQPFGNSPGGFINGKYEQQTDAALLIELSGLSPGLEYDVLTVSGNAQLGGELRVALDGGFTPTTEDAFAVVVAEKLMGDFDNIADGERIDTIDGRGSFLVTFTRNADPEQIVLSGFLPFGLPGDYNSDGVVNAADYTVWRDNLGQPAGTLPNDPTGGAVGPDQYNVWRTNYGASSTSLAATNAHPAPEPAAWLLFAAALGSMLSGISGPRNQCL